VICYFDTSAFVPLLIAEPGSPFCRRLWDEADDVVTTRMLYAEAAAALAQARRLERLTEPKHQAALHILDRMWADFDIVEVSDQLVHRAAQLARTCALRGYDAVHCASAEQVNDDDLVVASGDRRVLDSCATLGLATADTNGA
jgi:predicted nucleic acid-binding protein